MYRVEHESASRTIPHIQRLMDEHAEEMAHYPHLMPAAPDPARYQHLEEAGVLACFLLLHGEDVVGYAVSVFVEHPHHKGLRMLMNDALYVSKAHRKGRNGISLMNHVERFGKANGVQLVTWNAQPETPLAALLPRMGYREMNTTFCKEV